ncbi:chromosomal replication initiator protein DnaA [Candidatus Saccharibacteria bacterium]|nr:chromosomal replication initiator protein DnaA [Candidatus Saccharibacteria bacterium]
MLWKSVLGEIELNISPSVYATWFKKTKLLSRDPDELVVGVPNVFTQKQLETQFRPLVKKALAKNKVECKKISYRVVSTGKNAASPAGRQGALADSGIKGKSWAQNYRLGLNGRYTFDSFIPGPGNDLAYAAAQAVANNLGKKYNPLFVYGGVGIGKTHLIQAIGNEVSKRDPKLKVVYVTIEQFVQEFTDAIRYKQTGAFSNKYRSTDVLIIDDIQFIANKEKTQEEFFHTFNILHESGKQIIISSDKPPISIPTLEERLKSRFQMGMLIDMQIPDFETRCAILKFKAEALGLKIEYECIEFLASNISTNIRVLEGILNQLNAVREINQVELITLQLAKRIFDNQFKKAGGRLTAKKIIEKTADHYQVGIDELMGPKRDKEVVLPRQIAMYLMRRELHSSFPKIARSLGRKDHTTAIHSIGKIEKQLAYNEDLKESLVRIKESLAV